MKMTDFSISTKVAILIEYHGACKFIFSKDPNYPNDLHVEFYYEDVHYPLKFDEKTNTIKRLEEYVFKPEND